ncbi:hypothetical protein EJB05_15628, partial [Eragrostis curvula]
MGKLRRHAAHCVSILRSDDGVGAGEARAHLDHRRQGQGGSAKGGSDGAARKGEIELVGTQDYCEPVCILVMLHQLRTSSLSIGTTDFERPNLGHHSHLNEALLIHVLSRASQQWVGPKVSNSAKIECFIMCLFP